MEKALVLFRKGYENDITNPGYYDGTNLKTNLRQLYLRNIAFTLDKMGRTAEANSVYTELSEIADVTDTIASRIGIQQTTNRQQSGQSQSVYGGVYKITKFETVGHDNSGSDTFLLFVRNSNGFAFLTFTSLERMNDPFKNFQRSIIFSKFNHNTSEYEAVNFNGQEMEATVGKITITGNRIRLELILLGVPNATVIEAISL